MVALRIDVPDIYKSMFPIRENTYVEHPPVNTRLPETLMADLFVDACNPAKPDRHLVLVANNIKRLKNILIGWADAAGVTVRRRPDAFRFSSTLWLLNVGDDLSQLPFQTASRAVFCGTHPPSGFCDGPVVVCGDAKGSGRRFRYTIEELEKQFDDLDADHMRFLTSTRDSFMEFFKTWEPSPDYKYGKHTTRMIEELDRLVKDVENGEDRNLILSVPFRHGKSDVGSRRFPPWILLRHPEWEVISCSYNFSLSAEMSLEARRCFRDDVCPVHDRAISKERNQIGSWKLPEGGGLFAAGLGGTVTGRGADILIIDDYFKNREEAESETVRNRVWNSFQSDLMTRRAPKSGVVIIANRWHEDDLVGRIKNKNDKEHEDYDDEFPIFDEIKFAAEDEDGKFLFLERFDEAWYKAERAFLSDYAWSAQGNQNPQPRRGNLLRADLVTILDPVDFDKQTKGAMWRRGWDVASTEKERVKDKPDFTVGTRLAFHGKSLYIDDVVKGQWTALKRDEQVVETAKRDGVDVRVYVETVAGYKDMYIYVKNLLEGKVSVYRYIPKGDKVVRAGRYEAIFESGRVFIRRAAWNRQWLREIGAFPGGEKDDQVDSMDVAAHGLVTRRAVFS